MKETSIPEDDPLVILQTKFLNIYLDQIKINIIEK